MNNYCNNNISPSTSSATPIIINSNNNILKYFRQQQQTINILNIQQKIQKQINKQNNNLNLPQQTLPTIIYNNQQQNNQQLILLLLLQQQKLIKEQVSAQRQQWLTSISSNSNNYCPQVTFPSNATEGILSTPCSSSNVFLSPIKTNTSLISTKLSPSTQTFSSTKIVKKSKVGINSKQIKKEYKREFTIDELLLKEENKEIKKNKNKIHLIPKNSKFNQKIENVDYFMEEGQLSLTDGRRNGGGKIKGRKREGSEYLYLEYAPPLPKSPPPPLPSLLLQQPKFSPSKHICAECGKSYATSSNLSRHKQTHRPIDSPHAKKCPCCEKVYVSMPAFSMHLLTHQAKHKCPICGKLFSRPWLLKGHLRSHTGQKPFGCGKCGKAFSDRSNLRAHLNTHNAEKRWRCSHCGRAFVLKSYLNKHLEQQHGDENIEEEEEESSGNTSNNFDNITTIREVSSMTVALPSLCEDDE
uniref:C2H2-type domain-containing protein n=1 Tax=Meloidogyne hapla TaxID=6305 RepID=A0A1I8C0N9_MELHA